MNRPFAHLWQHTFDSLLEIESGQHNHYHSANKTTSTLTRHFCSIAPSAAVHLKFGGGVTQSPVDCWIDDLSDHSPVMATIAASRLNRSLPIRIRSEWAKHPLYSQHLAAIFHDFDFGILPLDQALELAKAGMREAGLKVRDFRWTVNRILSRVCFPDCRPLLDACGLEMSILPNFSSARVILHPSMLTCLLAFLCLLNRMSLSSNLERPNPGTLRASRVRSTLLAPMRSKNINPNIASEDQTICRNCGLC